MDYNEFVTQQRVRSWYQPGGVGTKPYFFGVDTLYHYIDSANMTGNGSIDPIFVPNPRVPGQYKLAGRMTSAPELPTASIVFTESWGGIPRPLLARNCEFNLIEVRSQCKDYSDLYRGWDGMALIYSGMKINGNLDLGARTARDSDEMLQITVEATGTAIYPVGALNFGTEADADVVVEVIDQVYGTSVQCGNCGTPNDGSQFIYAITRANVGSPSAPGQLIYSLDGGVTWTTALITGIGTSVEPRYIDIAGNILFVGTNGTSLFYTVLDELTGAPTTWNSVTQLSDFNDVYVQTPSSIFFVHSTNVYKTSDITIPASIIDSNSSNSLHRVSGYNKTIVAVGNNGEVRYSQNNGVTWISAVASSASNNRAVAVLSERNWMVGDVAGNVYKTTTAGDSWSVVAFPNYGVGSISDIVVSSREVIWIAQNYNNVAYLATTIDGGYSWTNSTAGSSRMYNFPVFQSINRIAVPQNVDPHISCNFITLGGLATGGADGVLITASPTIL